MGLGKGLKGFGVSAALAIGVLAPSVASAHALFVNPVPRDTTDTKLKMGPCGGDAMNGPLVKKQPVVQYTPGQKIMVDFKETVAHQGCYLFQLSTTGDDKNFTMLKLADGSGNNAQVADPAGSGGNQKVELQLPAGVTCQNCTLRMIQVMLGANCAANQDPTSTPNYYSCVDVRIGDFSDAGALMDAGPPDFDASSTDEPGSSSSGSTTTPTDGGGKTSGDDPNDDSPRSRNLRSGAGDDGCNVGVGEASSMSVFLTAGLAATALLRRRKKR